MTPRAQGRTTPCNRQQAGQRLRQAEGILRPVAGADLPAGGCMGWFGPAHVVSSRRDLRLWKLVAREEDPVAMPTVEDGLLVDLHAVKVKVTDVQDPDIIAGPLPN